MAGGESGGEGGQAWAEEKGSRGFTYIRTYLNVRRDTLICTAVVELMWDFILLLINETCTAEVTRLSPRLTTRLAPFVYGEEKQ